MFTALVSLKLVIIDIKLVIIDIIYSIPRIRKYQVPYIIKSRIREKRLLSNRAYPAVLLTQVSDTTHSMIGYKYLLAAV